MQTPYSQYYLMVLGCQMNYADADRIKAVLSQLGFKQTDQIQRADLIIVVACSVRQRAVDRIVGRANHWQTARQKGQVYTILTGCVNESDKVKLTKYFDLILPIQQITHLPRVLSQLQPLAVKDYFKIQPEYASKFQAYVPIMTGCNNFCSYCIVPYVRGREESRPASDIVSEVKQLLAAGYLEITLLGQNVNSYRSGSKNFVRLLKQLDRLPGKWWLRFLTSHPKDFSDDLIALMEGGQHITPYLHLALQSGDEQILKKMNRHYTPDDYIKLIKKIRQAIPEIMISTDIIVGFPSETKQQFLNTYRLFQTIEFDMAYISQYSPRPGTAASQLMDDVPIMEKKRRDQKLTQLLEQSALRHNLKFIGQEVEVLIEKCSSKKCLGKTADYRTVTFLSDQDLAGQFKTVKITRADSWGLYAESKKDPRRQGLKASRATNCWSSPPRREK